MPVHISARAKKITVDIPAALYKETEEIVNRRRITTSTFVREAIERYLRQVKQEQLEAELKHGYAAYEALAAEVHSDQP